MMSISLVPPTMIHVFDEVLHREFGMAPHVSSTSNGNTETATWVLQMRDGKTISVRVVIVSPNGSPRSYDRSG
jgi:hypothetical protein